MSSRLALLLLGICTVLGLIAGYLWLGEPGPVDHLSAWLFARETCPHCGADIDPGLPWYWIVFGFAAQALFMSRMLVQWIASERAKRSVVPTAFWLLSLLGGLTLCIYFLRRSDPVGVSGQAFGVIVYLRNLIFIKRERIAGGIDSN